jgi:hypothetical protein
MRSLDRESSQYQYRRGQTVPVVCDKFVWQIGILTAMRVPLYGDMKCDERARLLGSYNRAALAISTTVDDLLHDVGVVSNVIYDLRRHAARKARIGFELATLAYDAHVSAHRCIAST